MSHNRRQRSSAINALLPKHISTPAACLPSLSFERANCKCICLRKRRGEHPLQSPPSPAEMEYRCCPKRSLSRTHTHTNEKNVHMGAVWDRIQSYLMTDTHQTQIQSFHKTILDNEGVIDSFKYYILMTLWPRSGQHTDCIYKHVHLPTVPCG